MEVPILITFKNGGMARTRVLVTGPVTEVELPLAPIYPEDVIFNDMQGALADVRTESW
jgi:hypothetical protein